MNKQSSAQPPRARGQCHFGFGVGVVTPAEPALTPAGPIANTVYVAATFGSDAGSTNLADVSPVAAHLDLGSSVDVRCTR